MEDDIEVRVLYLLPMSIARRDALLLLPCLSKNSMGSSALIDDLVTWKKLLEAIVQVIIKSKYEFNVQNSWLSLSLLFMLRILRKAQKELASWLLIDASTPGKQAVFKQPCLLFGKIPISGPLSSANPLVEVSKLRKGIWILARKTGNIRADSSYSTISIDCTLIKANIYQSRQTNLCTEVPCSQS